MPAQPKNEKSNLILGRVVDKLNRPLANLIVQALDRDMRSEELLGECITDRDCLVPTLLSGNAYRSKKGDKMQTNLGIETEDK